MKKHTQKPSSKSIPKNDLKTTPKWEPFGPKTPPSQLRIPPGTLPEPQQQRQGALQSYKRSPRASRDPPGGDFDLPRGHLVEHFDPPQRPEDLKNVEIIAWMQLFEIFWPLRPQEGQNLPTLL